MVVMAEPKVGDIYYYLPELYEMKSIVRHQVYRTVGLTSNKKKCSTINAASAPKIVDRAPIIVIEPNYLHEKIEGQQKKITNSEMLETAGAQLEEELRQLKLEGQSELEQLLETKKLEVNNGNQRQSCRRLVEMLNRELDEAKK